jgi:EmrB/QacA subfamily drug resistance transporter
MFEYRKKVALIYMCAYFIDLMNTFIATIAFPQIGISLHANVSQMSWVVTSYILSLILVIPVSGYLGDKFGTKKLFLFSLGLFTTATFFCGYSSSIFSLIIWRFIQGIGGGLIIPVGQSMLYRLYHAKERAKISAAVLIPAVIAPMIAPSIGGFLVQYFSWNMVFYFSVPFSAILFVLSFFLLKEEKQEIHHKIDILGLFYLSICLTALMFLSYFIGDPHQKDETLISAAFTILFGVLFIFHAFKTQNPILKLKLYAITSFRTGNLLYFILSFSFSAVNIIMIYFAQNALNIPSFQTGLLMVPYGIGSMTGLKISGEIFHKFKLENTIIISTTAFILIGTSFTLINHASAYPMMLVLFLFYGLSTGFIVNSLQTLTFFHMDNREMGNASSIFNLNRQLGSSLGVSLMSALLSYLILNQLPDHVEGSLTETNSVHPFHVCLLVANLISLSGLIWFLVFGKTGHKAKLTEQTELRRI